MKYLHYSINNDTFTGGGQGGNQGDKIENLNLTIDPVYKYELKNGIRVIMIKMKSNIFSAGIFINAGSRHETTAYGIAHFLEHMTFKGTKTKSSEEVNEILDNLGAVYNATTSLEYTSYYLSGNPMDNEKLLEILLELYISPDYPEKDIEKERKVVLEEWRMNQDNYNRQLMEKMRKKILKDADDGLKRPVIGYEDTISKLNKNDILKFRENYKPENTVLVIAGKFKKKIMKKIIIKNFKQEIFKKSIPNYNINIHNELIIPFEKNTNKNHTIFIDKDIKQSIIMISFKAPSLYTKYSSAINLLSDILTSGFSSRIFNLLRNKLGVSYYSNSYFYSLSDCGFFNMTIGLDPNVITNSIKEILLELKNIIHLGITSKELIIAKKRSETSLLFNFKEPMEYVDYYGMIELFKKPYKNIIDVYNEINDVSVEDIIFVAKSLFKKDNCYIGIVGPVIQEEIKEIVNDENLFYS
jgi:predicted Zn-dependent peptidase